MSGTMVPGTVVLGGVVPGSLLSRTQDNQLRQNMQFTYKTCKKASTDPTRKVSDTGKVTVISHIQSRIDLEECRTDILLQLCVKHQVKARVRRIAD